MSKEVVAYQSASLSERKIYAETLSHAGQLIPRGLFDPTTGKPSAAKILLVMETGAMLGMHPMAAIQSIDVVEGKATLSSQLKGSLIRAAGHKLEIIKTGSIAGGDFKATVIGTRADSGDRFESTWDIPRAIRAGLVQSYKQNADGVWEVTAVSEKGKALPWQSYSENMCVWRAQADVGREGFGDVLFGLYSTDEIRDVIPLEEPEPEPSEDWEAIIADAQTREELDAIATRMKENGEGTDKLRTIWLAKAGLLKAESEDIIDVEIIEDDELGEQESDPAHPDYVAPEDEQ
ncbi:MAG: hypothetical protein WBA28_05005 [Microbacteriaceae bacterium]